MANSKKILHPLGVIKRHLLLDWVYFFTPLALCLLYGILAFDFSSLQMLVNSFFSNIFNLVAAIGLFIAIPNVATLVVCQKKVLKDMPSDIILKAASSERSGGAGCGKTSSAGLQAIFEATEMERVCTETYYYIKSNYARWVKENPRKVKDFAELEKSVMFWRENPQYIPFLGSNVTIYDVNGRKSYYVDGKALSQEVWIPAMFILIDEAGNELPQEMYKERPSAPTMFARYIRHFGFRMTLLEQKLDGLYINVRSVLGVRCIALKQDNKLLPYFLIDVLSFLKKILPKLDADERDALADSKKEKLRKHFTRLGKVIEKLQSFASKLGFRIWEQAIIPPESVGDLIKPEILQIYCTNEMPIAYDAREFSRLYLASNVEDSKDADYPTKDNEAGQHILQHFYEQEEQAKVDEVVKQKDALKAKNDLEKEKQRSLLLEKKRLLLDKAGKEQSLNE